MMFPSKPMKLPIRDPFFSLLMHRELFSRFRGQVKLLGCQKAAGGRGECV